jgi:hypothetical protein
LSGKKHFFFHLSTLRFRSDTSFAPKTAIVPALMEVGAALLSIKQGSRVGARNSSLSGNAAVLPAWSDTTRSEPVRRVFLKGASIDDVKNLKITNAN